MNLLKNIIRVAITNIVGFGTSFIINFLLPMILTVADYGRYKQYVLYISLTYLFNCGFNDGIYIKYGGQREEDIDTKTLQEEHQFVLAFQFLVLILMLGYAYLVSNLIIALFAVTAFFDAINVFHQNYLQATGQFALYTRGSISRSIFYVLILLVAVFIRHTDYYVTYILLNICSYLFLTLYFEWHFLKNFGLTPSLHPKDHWPLFRVGIFILLANMSLTFVGNVGNWVVKWCYGLENFAFYNFQNSILNVILLIVNAVGMVFYNVISKRHDRQILNVIKRACLLLGVGSGLAFFVFRLIIQEFLPKFEASIELLAITFISIPYIMLSRILIANLYKSTVSERRYFRDSVIYVLSAFAFVFLANGLLKSMLSVAVATTMAYVAWFLYASQLKFPNLKGSGKEAFLLISHAVCFILCANFLPNLMGAGLYLGYLAVIAYVYRDWLLGMQALLAD